MRQRILLTLHPVDGALLRVLAMVERRGFSIGDLTARQEDGCTEVVLDVMTQDRSFETLCRQLDKLVDVTAIRMAEGTEAPGDD